MRAVIAVVLVLVAAAVVVLALRLHPTGSSPAVQVGQAGPQSGVTPTAVVTAYVQALERKDYRKAYGFLSTESQQAHPYDSFTSQAESTGMTDYDLEKAKEEPGQSGSMTVVVPFLEDPAQGGFNLVRQGGAWKIVFIGGAPGAPYAEAK